MYKVNLEIFEGPFDLLLYLIKKNEVDIHDIPISKITQEYLEYLNMLKDLDVNVAGEFLVMAAQLMVIKSWMLLPPDSSIEQLPEGEEDPRAELVRQLLEYRQFKEAAASLQELEAKQREVFARSFAVPEEIMKGFSEEEAPLEVNLFDMLKAFQKVLDELPEQRVRELEREEVPVVQKMNEILDLLEQQESISFFDAFRSAQTKVAIVSTFLAMLELARMKSISIRQAQIFGEIRLYRLKIEAKEENPAAERTEEAQENKI